MSVSHDRPYSQFNIQVKIGEGQETNAGFQEVSGLEQAGSPRGKGQPVKIPGSHKVGDVTLKRGIVNSADLWAWLKQAKESGPRSGREVTITQFGEGRQPVKTWKLLSARPIKYTGPALSGKGSAVAIEEVIVSSEGIELVKG